MPHHYIPFANSGTDWPLVSSLYPEPAGCRTTLQLLLTSGSRPPLGFRLWIDTGVDGLHFSKINDADDSSNSSYKDYIQQFENYNRIADVDFQRKPDKSRTVAFVNAILNKAFSTVPNSNWLSVPQLPYTDDADRNKINRLLAEATMKWKSKAGYRGKLILPVVLAKTGLTDRKTDRNAKVKLANDCFGASDAKGVWIVDSTLDDQDGVGDFEDVRFPGIIKFHEELNSSLPADAVSVAGPYWGLNLVLWARGSAKLPAIGVGRSYRYYLAGGRQKAARPRIALPPLRRLAIWSPDLRKWLEQAVRSLAKNDPAAAEFSVLLRNFDMLQNPETARKQVARFYSDWFEKLELVPPSSRALGLYQDLSAAYVLGTGLPMLPTTEKAKNASRIAKQLMGNCL
jgi:hypothetical protein